MEDLNGDIALYLGIEGFPDLGHSPTPQTFPQLIFVETMWTGGTHELTPLFSRSCYLLYQYPYMRLFLLKRGIYFIGFRCHDEVVAMQTIDAVGPPCNTNAAPFDQECGMVAFLLSDCAYLVCKIQRSKKVLKSEDALQALDAIAFDDDPFGNLRTKLFQFFLGNLR